jgi:transcriptional regulator with XRE-family HTH domain
VDHKGDDDQQAPNLDEDAEEASRAFGVRLKALREEHGISQDKLADETNIHPTAIGRMERGKREPRLTTILKLARGLGVKPGELLDELR